MNSLSIRKGDTVVVLSGKDKGKKGKIISTIPSKQKVIVEGVNMSTKHKKPRRQTDPGGIMHQESPIYACKVMLYCNKCGQATRVGHVIDNDGEKTRRCKNCTEQI